MRKSFTEILEAARPETRARLGEKAQRANKIAKSVRGRRSRRAAYAVKTAALEQGVRFHDFLLVGDHLARPWLAIVRTATHGSLHVRVDQLSSDIVTRPDVHLRLYGMSA